MNDPLSYVVTAVSATTGEESLPSASASITGPTSDDWPQGTTAKLSINPPAGTDYCRVYKAGPGGAFGYIGSASGTAFSDLNKTPDASDGPPKAASPFPSSGDQPGVVAFHQQRLVLASTTNQPNGVWMSRTGYFDNFSTSTPTKDDDAVTFKLASGELNAVKGITSVNDLVILTSGGEYVCNGGSTGAAITPSAISAKPQSYWGSAALSPLVSGNTVLFVSALDAAVRDLGYEFSVDGFTGNDRSMRARHLLEGHAIVSWCYAQTPDIERMAPRLVRTIGDAAYLDAHVVYDGGAADTITGLGHLEGKAVSALADGDYIPGLTVIGGKVVLPRAHTHVVVGLPYDDETFVETLEPDIGMVQGLGSTRGRPKRVSAVTVMVEASREFRAGPSADKMTLQKLPLMAYDAPIGLTTGSVKITILPTWNTNGKIRVSPNGPVPLNILAILPDIEIGG